MIERRGSERKPTSLRVEIFHPSIGMMIGRGEDISDSGLLAVVDHAILPPVGTVVSVKLKRITGTINEEAVEMRVVRIEKKQIALMFVS